MTYTVQFANGFIASGLTREQAWRLRAIAESYGYAITWHGIWE